MLKTEPDSLSLVKALGECRTQGFAPAIPFRFANLQGTPIRWSLGAPAEPPPACTFTPSSFIQLSKMALCLKSSVSVRAAAARPAVRAARPVRSVVVRADPVSGYWGALGWSCPLPGCWRTGLASDGGRAHLKLSSPLPKGCSRHPGQHMSTEALIQEGIR